MKNMLKIVNFKTGENCFTKIEKIMKRQENLRAVKNKIFLS
jgi:hypothetical protein